MTSYIIRIDYTNGTRLYMNRFACVPVADPAEAAQPAFATRADAEVVARTIGAKVVSVPVAAEERMAAVARELGGATPESQS